MLDAVKELVENSNEVMSYITETILKDYDGFVTTASIYKEDANAIDAMLIEFSNKSSDNTSRLLHSISKISDEATRSLETVNELNNEVNKFKKVD